MFVPSYVAISSQEAGPAGLALDASVVEDDSSLTDAKWGAITLDNDVPLLSRLVRSLLPDMTAAW